jgi:hypothetical protein
VYNSPHAGRNGEARLIGTVHPCAPQSRSSQQKIE